MGNVEANPVREEKGGKGLSCFQLKEVDKVEIITVIDNYVDLLLPDTLIAARPLLATGSKVSSETLLAEHGLSLWVRVYKGKESRTILFDTGYSRIGVLHNMERLALLPEEIEGIVLSHGHMDHTGSLFVLLDKLPGPVPLTVHPDIFLYPRYLRMSDGRQHVFPRTLPREDLEQRNVRLIESSAPTLLLDDMLLVTGEVERVTSFEKGLPNALVERNGKIEEDRMRDDQALVIRLRGKGLVIISGCSHAGIINTILYAMKITGEKKIHAVLGGFHLSGAYFEPIIEHTVRELKHIKPDVLVPMHCTGWKAVKIFSEEFPSSFVLNSVGTKIILNNG